MRRNHKTLATLTACMAIAAALLPGAPASASDTPQAASHPHASGVGMWVAGSTQQSFQSRVITSLANGVTLPVVEKVVSQLDQSAASGINPGLPGAPTIADARSQLKSLAQLLNQPSRLAPLVLQEKVREGTQGADNSAKATNGITIATAIAPQRGSAINDNRTWTFQTALAANYCQGTCVLEDYIYQTWKIGPGRNTDVFSFNSNYNPDNHDYIDIYAHVYAFCNGATCGNEIYPSSGPRNGIGTGTFYLTHTSNAGKGLIDEVDLTAHFNPTATTRTDEASTGSAQCQGGSNLSCIY